MIDPDRALDFLGFVEARHRAWVARQHGDPQPWCSDPIVQTRKFTSVFRILDFGTQFILTDLVEEGLSDRDMLMRLFLYRHTGRVEVWQYLPVALGGYPTVDILEDVLECWQEYRGETKVRSIFTGAYLVFPQSQDRGTDKLESIIRLTQRLFDPASPDDIVPDFLAATAQADRFAALRRNKGVADFMSMQVLTDWGYTPHCGVDREDEFVVPGPGARKGAAVLAPGWKAERTLEWAVEAVRSSPRCPVIELPDGRRREPSVMDIQNCACEYSKYVRFQDKPLPSKPYTPAHPGPQPAPILPEHW